MGRMTLWQRMIAVGLLGVFFAQMVTGLPQLSLTADEPVYMGAGYAFLRSGDLRLATAAQHPPLMQVLVALPLLLQPGPELEGLEGWDTAEMARFAPAFVAWYGENVDAATFAARMPVVIIALLWAVFLFRWAADWFGPWSGLGALMLFAFDPNILAHATLATNDAGFAAFNFIALFAAMRLLRRDQPRFQRLDWLYVVLTGVALGASLSAKSSGFFTAIVLAVLFLLTAFLSTVVDHDKSAREGIELDREGRAKQVGRVILQLAVIALLGSLVLWATYGFEVRPIEGGRLPVPMATQWEVWREMGAHLAEGHTSYLMGEVRETGSRAYYPVAFLLKTPLFTLVLLVLGLAAAVAAGPRRWLAMLPLWVFLGGYVAATLMSTVGTGYRFLLPLLPFVFLLIAGLFRDGAPWLQNPALRWGSGAVLALLAMGVALMSWPHYLTYFNFIAGGAAGGHRYLVDSNLDWGQSFRALQAYVDQQEIEQVWLSHYTYADAALYGVRYQPIAPLSDASPVLAGRFDPAPGVYAIGATTLQGIMLVDPDTYSWFRQRQTVARPGNAIFVYRVEEQNPRPTWFAQCTVPVAPLTPEVAAEGFGHDDLRLIYFDCAQSWLYPTAGEMPGWYALHRDMALAEDRFIEERLGEAHLSYEQRVDRTSPAFVIYELPILAQVNCSAEAQPLDGPLSFLGYTPPNAPVQAGDEIEIETCWQVTDMPSEPDGRLRPLSLMLHLVGPSGTPVIVGDGLGVPVESWQVGDVIVQRHRLALPADAPPGDYDLYTGAYWLDTMARWLVPLRDATTTDRLVLDKIPVVD